MGVNLIHWVQNEFRWQVSTKRSTIVTRKTVEFVDRWATH